MSDLKKLAHLLLTRGPVKTLPANRRVRIQLAGQYIIDTTNALFVWEHEYYPQYYVPLSSLSQDMYEKKEDLDRGARQLRIKVGNKSTDRVIAFDEDLGRQSQASAGGVDGGDGGRIRDLECRVRIEFGSVDGWYEEDTQIFVHPKDPFKRVDILPSTREIKIYIPGLPVGHAYHNRPIASSTFSHHLHETSLPTRYYLPPTSIPPSLLRPSKTTTRCPYKGEANYYDVVLPSGEEYKDLVWYYRYPIRESAPVEGQLCFYNEKVEVEVDGVKEKVPKTHFA